MGQVASQVVAILCSDLHISTCPSARSAEPDWFEAMARQFEELRNLSKHYKVPVICAGDVFDKWNPSPEIINFAIANLPFMYSIPGQHDLPNHRLDEVHRSAYHTLVEAKVLCDLRGVTHALGTRVMLHPFPWGVEITPLVTKEEGFVHLAVVHRYVWQDGFGYTGADVEKTTSKYRNCLQGYDAAVFGDNHKGFVFEWPGFHGINCGTFFRRKSDEVEYQPRIGLLHADGYIASQELHVLGDVFVKSIESQKPAELAGEVDTSGFLEQIKALCDKDSLDFREYMRVYMDQQSTNQSVRELVLSVMG